MKNKNIWYVLVASIPLSIGMSYLSNKFFNKDFPPSFFAVACLVCCAFYDSIFKNERE